MALKAYEEAVAAYEAGEYRTAIEKFHEVIADQSIAESGKQGMWWAVAMSHLQLGELDAADNAASRSGRPAEEYESYRQQLTGPAQDEFTAGYQLARDGKYAEAIAAIEAALLLEGVDDDARAAANSRMALCYLELGEWGRAEEAAAVAGPTYRTEYDAMRAALMQSRGVSDATLPGYDGSTMDDEFLRAKNLYDAGDYAGALAGLEPLVQGSIDHGSFGEEIWMYVALCHFKLGHEDAAMGYSGFLTGSWLDRYNEVTAAPAP